MFYWNPDPVAFYLPVVHLPIYMYGICFVTGFILGYFLLLWLMAKQLPPQISKEKVQLLVDRLTWFVVAGTIIGARLGHVFLYDWERYRAHPWEILYIREGGLASHGGAIGVLLALWLYYRFIFRKNTGRSYLELLDMIVVPTALVAFFIRLGNFFNQEILGTPTDLPWGVIFGSPADHSLVVPRHPAQLYEGLAYLLTFVNLLLLKKQKVRPGFLTGLFFVQIFGARFLIEYVKAHQEASFDQSLLQAGQLLSIPFILAGALLLYRALRRHQVREQ